MAVRRLRLDLLLVERSLTRSREKARALVMAAQVRVDGQTVTKPGTQVAEDARIDLEQGGCPWVGRGGLKMEGALDRFGLDAAGRTALDIGASTGGFTEVLLHRGAAAVVAVDVGYGQLDWKLRRDTRVRLMERTNARYLEPSDLPDDLPSPPDLAVIDVSFISLTKVLPAVSVCLVPPADILALVKPQFEAGPADVGRGGVVKDPQVHRQVLARLLEWSRAQGLTVRAGAPSPVKGATGNREFFLWLRPGGGGLSEEEERDLLEDLVPGTGEP